MFRKKQSVAAAAAQLRGGMQSPFGAGLPAVPPGEAQLYRAMRQSLPVLDAAIGKLFFHKIRIGKSADTTDWKIGVLSYLITEF